MKVYIVFEGVQNDTDWPIAVYSKESSAKARKKLEEERWENDLQRVSDRSYWDYEEFEVIDE
jgi:hypothetical protein